MNQDEKFNYFGELMAKRHGKAEAERLERAMSEMLGMGVSPDLVWDYARRSIGQLDQLKRESEAQR